MRSLNDLIVVIYVQTVDEDSTMEINQSLSDRMSDLKQYGPDDPLWYRFVRDHKKYIKRNSKSKTFIPEELIKYKYRPVDFFVKELGGRSNMAWIFLFVNDIRDTSEFNENCSRLIIVEPKTIEKLYQIFSTSSASVKALEV